MGEHDDEDISPMGWRTRKAKHLGWSTEDAVYKALQEVIGDGGRENIHLTNYNASGGDIQIAGKYGGTIEVKACQTKSGARGEDTTSWEIKYTDFPESVARAGALRNNPKQPRYYRESPNILVLLQRKNMDPESKTGLVPLKYLALHDYKLDHTETGVVILDSGEFFSGENKYLKKTAKKWAKIRKDWESNKRAPKWQKLRAEWESTIPDQIEDWEYDTGKKWAKRKIGVRMLKAMFPQESSAFDLQDQLEKYKSKFPKRHKKNIEEYERAIDSAQIHEGKLRDELDKIAKKNISEEKRKTKIKQITDKYVKMIKNEFQKVGATKSGEGSGRKSLYPTIGLFESRIRKAFDLDSGKQIEDPEAREKFYLDRGILSPDLFFEKIGEIDETGVNQAKSAKSVGLHYNPDYPKKYAGDSEDKHENTGDAYHIGANGRRLPGSSYMRPSDKIWPKSRKKKKKIAKKSKKPGKRKPSKRVVKSRKKKKKTAKKRRGGGRQAALSERGL